MEAPEISEFEQLKREIAAGQAIVIVGAGFSKNAEGVDSKPNTFKDWKGLEQSMSHALRKHFVEYGLSDEESEGILERYVNKPLELANFIESVIGRKELIDLILDAVPDNDHVPGEAHRLLIKLPWFDILTTNYDTLIERACEELKERREIDKEYFCVRCLEDVGRLTRPTIFKIHGDLRSVSEDRSVDKLTITERDYITYNYEKEVFVTLIRATLLTKACCLIGFSGDDPHFKEILTWTQSRLGDSEHPIFFVSVKGLSPCEKKLFSKRKIEVISLSERVKSIETTSIKQVKDPYGTDSITERIEARNRKKSEILAVEQFLIDLGADSSQTPEQTYAPKQIPSHLTTGFCPPTQTIGFRPVRLPFVTKDDPNGKQLLLETLENWQQENIFFGNWIITPSEYREHAWTCTEPYVSYLFPLLRLLDPPDDLNLMYELASRIEYLLVPLFSNWIPEFTRILEKYNPFPEIIRNPDAISPASPDYASLGWDRIRDQWFFIYRWLTRTAREDGDADYPEKLATLERISRLKTEWRQYYNVEKARDHLFKLDEDGLRHTIESWEVNVEEFPLFAVRRAAFLFELGEEDDAKRLITAVIDHARNKQRENSDQTFFYALEGLALYIESVQKVRYSSEEDREEISRRLQYLNFYRCNPETEIEVIKGLLRCQPPEPTPWRNEKVGFDPGHRSVTYSFSSDSQVSPDFTCYSLLQLIERSGIPIYIGNFSPNSLPLSDAAIKAYEISKPWGLNYSLRLGLFPDIEELFTRINVAVMSDGEVQQLYSAVFPALKYSLDKVKEADELPNPSSALFSLRLLRILPEILSRLSIRVSPQQQVEVMKIGLELARNPALIERFGLQKNVKNILPRALTVLPPEILKTHVHDLIGLPIPGLHSDALHHPTEYRDVFENDSWYSKLFVLSYDSSLNEQIEELLSASRNPDQKIRYLALLRLLFLNKIKALNPEQRKNFGAALWADVSGSGMPSNDALRPYDYLWLPEPEEGHAKTMVRDHLNHSSFRKHILESPAPEGKKIRQYFPAAHDSLPLDIIGATVPFNGDDDDDPRYYIKWTHDELVHFLDKIDDHCDYLESIASGKEENPLFPVKDNVTDQVYGIIGVLRLVIIPNLSISDDAEYLDRAYGIFRRLEKLGFPIIIGLPILLPFKPELSSEIIGSIRSGLLSNTEDAIEDATIALYEWSIRSISTTQTFEQPPRDLWDIVLYRIFGLSQPGLKKALVYSQFALHRNVGILAEGQFELLYKGLEKLKQMTSYENRQGINGITGPISFKEIPEYRMLSSKLAFELFLNLHRKGEAVPPILLEWKALSQSDELPEVRKIWE